MAQTISCNLWQGATGINNPRPAGFRVPSQEEWLTERGTWSSKDSAGAFASPLKLVTTGYRDFTSDGKVIPGNGIVLDQHCAWQHGPLPVLRRRQ